MCAQTLTRKVREQFRNRTTERQSSILESAWKLELSVKGRCTAFEVTGRNTGVCFLCPKVWLELRRPSPDGAQGLIFRNLLVGSIYLIAQRASQCGQSINKQARVVGQT